MNYDIMLGDCLEKMQSLKDNSIDLILCDLPYGVTKAPWDKVIDPIKLWEEYKRIIKPYGTVILFAVPPFNSDLIQSNRANYSHTLYWLKNAPTGFLNAGNTPLKNIEEILVFRLKSINRNNKQYYEEIRKYFFEQLRLSNLRRKDIDKLLNNCMSSHYFTNGEQFTLPSKENYEKLQTTGYFQKPYSEILSIYNTEFPTRNKSGYTYNPQNVEKLKKPIKNSIYKSELYGIKTAYLQTDTNYPRQLLEYNVERGLHSTQKPVPLLEYLIKTYSNKWETVLDNTMGSGSTGVACINTNRKFIGIEKDPTYFRVAQERLRGTKNG